MPSRARGRTLGAIAIGAMLLTFALRPDPASAALLIIAAGAVVAALAGGERRLREMAATLEETQRRLVRLATTDDLTQLQNRGAFERSVEAEISRARRTTGRFAIVCVRLRGLSSLGRDGAEEKLREFASCLRRQTRAIDTRARLGGDEFAVVLVGADAQTTAVVSDRIRASCADLSIGHAHYPGDGEAPAELIRMAEERLEGA